MSALIRLVHLRKQERPISILAQAYKPVAPAALRAHEVQPEVIDARLCLAGLEFSATADAFPHDGIVPRVGDGRMSLRERLAMATCYVLVWFVLPALLFFPPYLWRLP